MRRVKHRIANTNPASTDVPNTKALCLLMKSSNGNYKIAATHGGDIDVRDAMDWRAAVVQRRSDENVNGKDGQLLVVRSS
jgi:hypothetical protein